MWTKLYLIILWITFVSAEITTFTNYAAKKDTTTEKKIRVLYVHDWNTRDLDKALKIKDTILNTRKDVGGVIICDWSTFSQSPDYNNVAQKFTGKVASDIRNQIKSLEGEGVDVKDIELVGHGLGAHICGQVGKLVKEEDGKVIGKITGLDPTGPYFKDHPKESLKKGDATSVEVIHTDKRYGIYTDIGDVDTYPENGTEIEDCNNSRLLKRNLCLHNAALDVFIKTVNNSTSEESPKKRRSSDAQAMSILTLDVSPSMQSHGRIQNMITASRRLINSLPNGYSIGIVFFGGHATEVLTPTNVTDDSRRYITSKLPKISTQIGNTSIGAGVSKAIEVGTPYIANCPDIILVTDGEENKAPFLKNILPSLKGKCMKVHTIALGNEADEQLESLSAMTGGQTYFSGDVNSLEKLTQNLIAAAGVNDQSIELPSKQISLEPGDSNSQSASFQLDEGVGENTSFFISAPNPETLTAELIAPDGKVYGSANYTTDADLQGLLFKLLEVQPGNWTIKLNSLSDTKPKQSRRRRRRAATGIDKMASVYVSTFAKPGVESVKLEAYLSRTILDSKDKKPLAIEAFVSRGFDPVIGALVHAIVTGPDGRSKWVELLDNGNGADEEKDDGVYTRYITDKLEPGKRYGVLVIAVSNPNGTTMVGSIPDDPFQATDSKDLTLLGYSFERQTNAGSFRVAKNFQHKKLPPNPVKDLKVVNVDLENRECSLEWSAAGEEADNGTASLVQLRGFTTFGENGIVFTNDHVTEGSLSPEAGGSRQSVKVKVPEELWNKATKNGTSVPELYFTVRTKSLENELSDLSNVAPAEFSLPPEEVQDAGSDSLMIILIVLAIVLVLIIIGVVLLAVRWRRSDHFRVKHTNSQKM